MIAIGVTCLVHSGRVLLISFSSHNVLHYYLFHTSHLTNFFKIEHDLLPVAKGQCHITEEPLTVHLSILTSIGNLTS